MSDDEDEEDNDVIPLGTSDDRYRPQSLEKMIHLIAYIVEKSRDDSNQLQISQKDYCAIIGGKVGTCRIWPERWVKDHLSCKYLSY